MSMFDKIFTDRDFDQLNNMVRWNGLNRIKDESVAHHSFIVTWFSRIIVEELLGDKNDSFKLEVITYALFHDFDEMFSGDIIHGVKYNEFNGKEIKKSIDEYCNFKVINKFAEQNSSNNLIKKNMTGFVSKSAKSIVKLSDWLSMCFYLKKEIALGNKGLYDHYFYCAEKVNHASLICKEEMSHIYGPTYNPKILDDIFELNFSEYVK